MSSSPARRRMNMHKNNIAHINKWPRNDKHGNNFQLKSILIKQRKTAYHGTHINRLIICYLQTYTFDVGDR